MKLADFNYNLPEELIAQYPLAQREQARMMVIDRAAQSIIHDTFQNIDHYLPENTHLILNDSKVVPARLLGVKDQTGAQVEIFLLKQLDDGYSWEVLMRPMKRLREGSKVLFEDDVVATIADKDKRIVTFNKKDLTTFLESRGHIPLPPYVKREDEKSDRREYQTVYAKKDGSVAAPTAGMHFTEDMLTQLQERHRLDYVTLHIGYGTFQPVEAENVIDHDMHFEYYQMNASVWNRVQKSKNICAVGTTSTRVLESVAATEKIEDETNLFIYPGYSFKMVNQLLTNFHLPKSTLLMLVYAFGGVELMQKAYAEAIKEKYRFYSYGDCMLIL